MACTCSLGMPGIILFSEMIFNMHKRSSFELLPVLIVLFIFREENVAQLLKSMFEKMTSEASIVNGTQVLLTLLESRRTG